jgi:hypothetical protein
MFPSLLLYYVLLAACAALLVWRCARIDRALAGIVLVALLINVTGAAAMGWWVRHKHGREYTAGDEISYQWEGARLLRSWRTGHGFVRGTVGAYAPINGVVIAIAGPGQTQMRVTTAVVGAAGVASVYWLAFVLYGRRTTARVAAFLAMTSPLLILYSLANLRDRWIGLAAVLTVIALIKIMDRWSWLRLAAVFATLLALGELRHYWAAILGWLSLPAYVALAQSPWRKRMAEFGVLFIVVGIALWIVTGSFFAYASRRESATRYVSVSPGAANEQAAKRDGLPQRGGADRDAREHGSGDEEQELNGPPPFSGETLGRAEAATRPAGVREVLGNLWFVLFGRVHARPDAGQYASKLLLPESLWSFVLLPLAVGGFLLALASGRRAALVPAAYIAAIIAILTWLRGDDWNTYRFRGLYWSMLLVFAAAGVVWVIDRIGQPGVHPDKRTAAV